MLRLKVLGAKFSFVRELTKMRTSLLKVVSSPISDFFLLFFKVSRQEIRIRAAVAIFAIFVVSLFQSCSPLALRYAVDSLAAHKSYGSLLSVSTYLILLFLSRSVTAYLTLSFGHVWRAIAEFISTNSYDNLLRQSYSIHKSQNTGQLKQTITAGVAGARSIVSAMYFNIIPVIFRLLTIFFVMATVLPLWDPIILLCCSLIYSWKMYTDNTRARSMQKTALDKELEVSGATTDMLLNFELVKLYGAEDWVKERLDSEFTEISSRWMKYFRGIYSRRLSSVALIIFIWFLLLMPVTVRILNHEATVGDFVLLNAYIIQIIMPVEQLGSGAREALQGLYQFERLLALCKIHTRYPTQNIIYHSWNYKNPKKMLVSNLGYSHNGSTKLLDNISFEMAVGTAIAVVGKSGGGKSTLARLLSGLLDPTGGSIHIDTVDLANSPPCSNSKISRLVSQEVMLLNDTIFNNLTLGRLVSKDELARVIWICEMTELIERLPQGLDTVVGERGSRLSGGERQRVAIARALIDPPPIMIFDEATSALDASTEAKIFERLTQGPFTSNFLIFITHKITSLKDFADILVLQDGTVAQRGNHSSLLAVNGIYRELWAAQTREGTNERHIPVNRV